MNIITAIENKEINEQLKNINNIKILNPDIQYKEGILEYLEKNKNVEIIILKENLPGQIEILELIKKIQKINNKIKTIIIVDEKNKERIINENIKYVYLQKINKKNIFEILKINIQEKNIENNKNCKIIKITGNEGSGKTIITIIFSKILAEIKNKKILIIEDNKTINNLFFKNIRKENNEKIEKNKFKIQNKIYLLNINYLINKKINILEYINKIKKEFNYIIIDSKNNNKYYGKIIDKNIYLLETNILEIEKAKKYIIKTKNYIILNKTNINNLDKRILEKTINKKIIGEVRYSKNYNLFINKNFNLDYLNKKEKLNLLNIIKKL